MHNYLSTLRRSLLSLAMVIGVGMGLTGCVLSPQVIELNDSADIDSNQLKEPRNAMVRVVDQRGVDDTLLGYRGGRMPENSPLLSEKPLKKVLTERLKESLEDSGFGGAGSDSEPLKVQLDINSFDYQCNEGVIVNDCKLDITLTMVVLDGDQRFDKPYTISQTRAVAVSPAQEYNEEWVNEALDTIWGHIFKDPELLAALGISR